MSNVNGEYVQTAEALVMSARMDAVHSVGGDHDRLQKIYTDAEWTVRHWVRVRFDLDTDSALVVTSGILAAHLLQSRLRNIDEFDAADMVADALPALRTTDLHVRLERHREVRRLADATDMTPTRELATLLRTTGSQMVAASGHLTRTVIRAYPDYRPGASLAWHASFGEPLLLPREVTRAVALGMVDAGRPKREIASLAGVSRTTLDAWLSR